MTAAAAARSISRRYSSFGLRFEITARGADRLALLGHDAGGAALLDDHFAHAPHSTRMSAPCAAAAFAIACVIAPMPPIAWPHAPFLPFTSPKH